MNEYEILLFLTMLVQFQNKITIKNLAKTKVFQGVIQQLGVTNTLNCLFTQHTKTIMSGALGYSNLYTE